MQIVKQSGIKNIYRGCVRFLAGADEGGKMEVDFDYWQKNSKYTPSGFDYFPYGHNGVRLNIPSDVNVEKLEWSVSARHCESADLGLSAPAIHVTWIGGNHAFALQRQVLDVLSYDKDLWVDITITEHY